MYKVTLHSRFLAVVSTSIFILVASCSGGGGDDVDSNPTVDTPVSTDPPSQPVDTDPIGELPDPTTFNVEVSDQFLEFFGADPNKVDTDGDGLVDVFEVAYG